MKKKIITAALCMGILFSMTACAGGQDNTDAGITDNSGTAAVSASPGGDAGRVGTPSPKPESVTDNANSDVPSDVKREVSTFTSGNRFVTYNIDAEVYEPEVSSSSVLKVRVHNFTPEEIEHISRVILGDTEFYEYTEDFSKEQLQTLISKWEQEMNDEEKLTRYYDGDKEKVQHYQQLCQERIDAINADMANAPDEMPKTVSDFSYQLGRNYMTERSGDYLFTSLYLNENNTDEYVMATAEVSGVPYVIEAIKNGSDQGRMNIISIRAENPLDISDRFEQTTDFTEQEKEEARALVEKTLNDLGIGEWKILYSDVYSRKVGTEELGNRAEFFRMGFSCVPVYNGVAYSGLHTIPEGDIHYNDALLNSTKIEIVVSGGKIISFSYNMPIEIIEEVNSNAALMTYEDAITSIKERLNEEWTLSRIATALLAGKNRSTVPVEAEVNIYRIDFGMVKTDEEDGEFYLTPAWFVYGDYMETKYAFMDRKFDVEPAEIIAGPGISDEWYYQSRGALLAVNAINGGAEQHVCTEVKG